MLEVFTAYTEVDPSSHLTVSANAVAFAGVDMAEDSYVYKDKGAAYFNANFTHDITVRQDAEVTTGTAIVWMLSNAIATYGTQNAGNYNYLAAILYNSTLYIQEHDGTTTYNAASSYAVSNGTTYYLRLRRDEAIGSFGRFYLDIYSDAARTNLLEAQTIDLHTSKKDYQYVYAFNSFGTSSGSSITGEISSLILTYDEVIEAAPFILASSLSGNYLTPTYVAAEPFLLQSLLEAKLGISIGSGIYLRPAVLTGPLTLDNTRLDLTAANAFAWLNGVDLTPYQDDNYDLVITDSAGKVLRGFIKASVPAGESLGTEQLSNPSFDAGIADWTPVAAILASIPGGQLGNCLEITRTGGLEQDALGTATAATPGALYRLGSYAKQGSAGAGALQIQAFTGGVYVFQTFVPTDAWVGKFAYCVANNGANNNLYLIKYNATPGTCLFDEASVKRVLDPPSTGVHIVTTLGGATRGWVSEESGFNPNDANGYTFQVRPYVELGVFELSSQLSAGMNIHWHIIQRLVNAIRWRNDDLRLVNALNFDVTKDLRLVNDIVQSVEKTLRLKLDINDLAEVAKTLSLRNALEGGYAVDKYYFDEAHDV